MKDFDTFTKRAQNVGDLGKKIDATGFEKLPKEQKIAQSGHTVDSKNILFSSFQLKGAEVVEWPYRE